MLQYKYVKPDQAEKLRTYKYNGGDKSLLYSYVLSPIANFCVEYLIPSWMAPNLLTLIGFMCIFIPHLIVLAYFPETLEGDVPMWLSLILATLHFLYMNFDNCDGKQARKTGNSSPLGLLFDHGCDSLVVMFQGLSLATCMQFGNNMKSLMVYLIGCLPFFFTTLEEYYTDALVLPVVNGPSEGCLSLGVFFVITAIFGSQWWNEQDNIFPWARKDITFGVFVGASFFNVIFNLYCLFKAVKDKFRDACEKMIFYVYVICSVVFVFLMSPTGVANRKTRILIYILGFNFGKLATMLQLAHVSRSEFRSFRKTTFLIITSLNINTLLGIFKGECPIDEDLLLIILLIASIFAYLHMVINVVSQMASALNIPIFKLKPKAKDQ